VPVSLREPLLRHGAGHGPQPGASSAGPRRRVAGLDQHVEYDHRTKRYRSVARCRCGRDKVWLSGAVREFLEADRELGAGVERDPGVGEGHEGMLRAGVPIFLEKAARGVSCPRISYKILIWNPRDFRAGCRRRCCKRRGRRSSRAPTQGGVLIRPAPAGPLR
jgi:hypothetical protein